MKTIEIIVTALLTVVSTLLPIMVISMPHITQANKIKKNIKNMERMLQISGFIISRKVGKFTYWLNAVQPFILYIDDKNKKWFMASLFFPEESKIFDFDELQSYEVFDEASPPILKEAHGLPLTALYLGIVDMLEGVFSDEFYKILRYKSGIVMSYGIRVKTNDEPLEFDFLEVARRFIKKQSESRKIKVFGVKIFRDRSTNTKTGIEKKSRFYKKSSKLMGKMEKAFIDIVIYNQSKSI